MNYFFRPLLLLLLLLIVYDPIVSSRTIEELHKLIRKAAENGELINGVLKLDSPREIDEISQSSEAIVWKGIN